MIAWLLLCLLGMLVPTPVSAQTPEQPPTPPDAPAPAPAPPPPAPTKLKDRYQDGIVIYETGADESIPFLLKFNVNTQIRYLNTTDSPEEFTDHLGVEREVHTRNDITVNRSMFILGGYVFDKRLLYSCTVWTSAGAASIVVAGNIGYRVLRRCSTR